MERDTEHTPAAGVQPEEQRQSDVHVTDTVLLLLAEAV
eukprot:CAMPEP_0194525382 /NCGR_PEP_ID=MMETSP0253-20130528/60831_1 /TAXON_ID=2966 /ORGANISM="Noctiluca scintillans" /LENGTH=37 /DNA_ID= /DNA_START= /DNA_END= /DNA_ORIENTATION=